MAETPIIISNYYVYKDDIMWRTVAIRWSMGAQHGDGAAWPSSPGQREHNINQLILLITCPLLAYRRLLLAAD